MVKQMFNLLTVGIMVMVKNLVTFKTNVSETINKFCGIKIFCIRDLLKSDALWSNQLFLGPTKIKHQAFYTRTGLDELLCEVLNEAQNRSFGIKALKHLIHQFDLFAIREPSWMDFKHSDIIVFAVAKADVKRQLLISQTFSTFENFEEIENVWRVWKLMK